MRKFIRKEFPINDITILIDEEEGLNESEMQYNELLKDSYCFDKIDLQPDDLMLDIGMNIGLTSLYAIKKFGMINILGFEPAPETFSLMRRNMLINGIFPDNIYIKPYQLAVTGDGRDLKLVYHPYKSGQTTMCFPNESIAEWGVTQFFYTKSISINNIFDKYGIKKVNLLKIDIEGAEFEVLNSCMYLDRVDWLVGEYHLIGREFGDIEKLIKFITTFVKKEHVILRCMPSDRLPDYVCGQWVERK